MSSIATLQRRDQQACGVPGELTLKRRVIMSFETIDSHYSNQLLLEFDGQGIIAFSHRGGLCTSKISKVEQSIEDYFPK